MHICHLHICTFEQSQLVPHCRRHNASASPAVLCCHSRCCCWVKTWSLPRVCVYYDVQTACKQLSVKERMVNRAKFPLRHKLCPAGLTQKVIPSSGLQTLCSFCLEAVVFRRPSCAPEQICGLLVCA